MAEDDDVKPEVIDVDQMKRENFFNLGRDDYMSLDEYLLSAQSDRDLRNKRGKTTLPKKKKKKVEKKKTPHIMELKTNVPRLQKGAMLGDLDKDGKMSGYEKVRQKAIEKSMAAQKNK
tara:strand:+ start:1088 stop:1441 length:354 start_codon:yes stop_codon:yes gene_type:complete